MEEPAGGGRQRTLGEQLMVRAALDDDSALHDGHLRRCLDRGQAVRDYHHGATGLHALQRFLHQRLALRVQRARRLRSARECSRCSRAFSLTCATMNSTQTCRNKVLECLLAQ
jgi:hypothetical protein